MMNLSMLKWLLCPLINGQKNFPLPITKKIPGLMSCTGNCCRMPFAPNKTWNIPNRNTFAPSLYLNFKYLLMRKSFSLAIAAIVTFCVQAQTDNKVVIGKIDSVYSKLLSEQRKIWVYTPDMTSGNRDQRWPVLYLLDGDGHFPSVVGMIQQMSQVNGNSVYPEMIVVGIPNTDRTRDLTPTHVVSDPPMMDSNSSKTTGGGENFVAFIEKALMPHIYSVYPTAPYKVLIGHSFGGLTVMNV